MVTLKCFGIPGYHLDNFEIEVTESISLKEFIHELPKQVEGDLKQLIFHDDKLQKGVYVLVNGRSIESLDGLNTTIQGDDEVVITKILVGG